MDRKWDVIVVGAGPVGSYLASLLAGWGLATLVLEEHPDIGHRYRRECHIASSALL